MSNAQGAMLTGRAEAAIVFIILIVIAHSFFPLPLARRPLPLQFRWHDIMRPCPGELFLRRVTTAMLPALLGAQAAALVILAGIGSAMVAGDGQRQRKPDGSG
jgi:hypothetical protein